MSTATGTADQLRLLLVLFVLCLAIALASQRLHLPYTLALVVVGLILGFLRIGPRAQLEPDLVLFIFLPVLLFEGAWNVDVAALVADWLAVTLLALPGLALSMAVVAASLHWGAGYPWLLAVLLGAMVSPTDPVAVLAFLRQLGISRRLRTIIEGESLFNDGVGAAAYEIVLGLLLATVAVGAAHSASISWTLAARAVWLMLGGLVLGVLGGVVVTRLLRRIDDYRVEVAITVTVAYGAYLLGVTLQTSGLLAVVGAGLVLASYGRRVGMSEQTRQSADIIWEFVGYVANSFLFLLLGLQIGAARFAQSTPAILWAVGGVALGRLCMVVLLAPGHNVVASWCARRGMRRLAGLRPPRRLPGSWRSLLVLSGLRGALSIALVLSLPASVPRRAELAGIVYGVVLITLVGQGAGLRLLLKSPRGAPTEATEA